MNVSPIHDAATKAASLILSVALCFVLATVAGVLITKANPRWSKPTKQLVFTLCLLVAAMIWIGAFALRR